MIRSIDWRCSCGHVLPDAMAAEDATNTCTECGAQMEQDWLPRRRHNAQWDDGTAVLVLVNNDPSCPADVRIRYPGRHDARIPPGYERQYLRSLRDVDTFCKQNNVLNHRMEYDSNGRGADDTFRGDRMTH